MDEGDSRKLKLASKPLQALVPLPRSHLWDGYTVDLRILFSWHLFKKYLSPGLFCHSPSPKVGMEFSKMYIVSRLLLTLNTKCPLHTHPHTHRVKVLGLGPQLGMVF